jgi:hypothetical protein
MHFIKISRIQSARLRNTLKRRSTRSSGFPRGQVPAYHHPAPSSFSEWPLQPSILCIFENMIIVK